MLEVFVRRGRQLVGSRIADVWSHARPERLIQGHSLDLIWTVSAFNSIGTILALLRLAIRRATIAEAFIEFFPLLCADVSIIAVSVVHQLHAVGHFGHDHVCRLGSHRQAAKQRRQEHSCWR